MQTEYSMEMLKKLTSAYGLDFVDGGKEKIDFFFTDSVSMDALAEKEKEKLRKDKTEICLLQNPMTESISDKGVTVINKSLYSLNFCQAVNRDRQGLSAEEENVLNFTAPDGGSLL